MSAHKTSWLHRTGSHIQNRCWNVLCLNIMKIKEWKFSIWMNKVHPAYEYGRSGPGIRFMKTPVIWDTDDVTKQEVEKCPSKVLKNVVLMVCQGKSGKVSIIFPFVPYSTLFLRLCIWASVMLMVVLGPNFFIAVYWECRLRFSQLSTPMLWLQTSQLTMIGLRQIKSEFPCCSNPHCQLKMTL